MDIISTEGMGKKELALQAAGATRKLAYETLVSACSATVIKYDRDGDCLGEQPDYATRVKAAESISRLNGDLKDEMVGGTRIINISVGAEALGTLLHMVKDVAEQLRSLKSSGQQTGEIIDVVAS